MNRNITFLHAIRFMQKIQTKGNVKNQMKKISSFIFANLRPFTFKKRKRIQSYNEKLSFRITNFFLSAQKMSLRKKNNTFRHIDPILYSF